MAAMLHQITCWRSETNVPKNLKAKSSLGTHTLFDVVAENRKAAFLKLLRVNISVTEAFLAMFLFHMFFP